MSRENYKLFIIWLEEFWEEIEIQFYGIIGAILFFFFIYLLFQPSWMNPSIEFVSSMKMFFKHFLSNFI